MTMDNQVDPLTVKKYFRHIIDKNQSFLSAVVQERRLSELGNRIANKMDIIEHEMSQLSQMITEFRSLEHSVKNNPVRPVQPSVNFSDIAQNQFNAEIQQLDRMYILLSHKSGADPMQLDAIAKRIAYVKERANTVQNHELS